MAKLCSEAYHCDLSEKGSTSNSSSGLPLTTIDWYDREEKVACVKKWYNRNCNCAGHNNMPCGDTAGNLIYNIPNSLAEAKGENYPKYPEQRIFSETTWKTQVPTSSLPPIDGSGGSFDVSGDKINRRKKIIRNVGIGAGILAAIVGIFALTKKKKSSISYYDPNRQQKLQDRQNEETVELIDEKTGKTITYKNPYFTGLATSDNTLLYGVLGVGVLALTIIIIKK
jgi:hypothetical protein